MDKLPEELKTEIWSQLKDHQMVYLATVDDDRPRLRPVTMGHYEDKFWLLTGTKDAKTAQIKSNPNIEILIDLINDGDRGYIRFIGKAMIVENQEKKNRIALKFPFFKDFWETPEDPDCTLVGFEIDRLEYLPPGEMWAKHFKL